MKRNLRLSTTVAVVSSTIATGILNNINVAPVVAIALATFTTVSVVAILSIASSK
jgi:hypothetical protein